MKRIKEITVVVVVLLLLVMLLQYAGCTATQSQPDRPLTVIPHPKFGFELVVVPAGTQIDGFTTTENGLYLSGEVLRYVIQKLELAEGQWAVEETQRGDQL